jgi:hypothetical protein
MVTFDELNKEVKSYENYERHVGIDEFEDNWVGMLTNIGAYRFNLDLDDPDLNSFSCYFPSKNTAKGVKSDPPLYRRPFNPELCNDWVKAGAEWAQKNMSIPSGKNNHSEG